MTLKERTIDLYTDLADWYIAEAKNIRISSKQESTWWKPRTKKQYLFLIKMANFYVDSAKELLKTY